MLREPVVLLLLSASSPPLRAHALLLNFYSDIVTLLVTMITRRRLGLVRVAAVLATLAGTALTEGVPP